MYELHKDEKMEESTTQSQSREVVLPGDFVRDGRILGLRSIRADYTSYGGFVNPVANGSEVMTTDWSEEPCCGNGLHFVPWGLGHEGMELGVLRPIFQVVEPIGKVIDLNGKCKAAGLRIVHTGTLAECMEMLRDGRIAFTEARASRSSSSATGYSSSSSATGDCTAAVCTAVESSARSGKFGCIALAFRIIDSDGDFVRDEMRCAMIGCGDGTDGKLRADTWYQLDSEGNFVVTTKEPLR
jgi:hypothetical protein